MVVAELLGKIQRHDAASTLKPLSHRLLQTSILEKCLNPLSHKGWQKGLSSTVGGNGHLAKALPVGIYLSASNGAGLFSWI